MLQFKLLSKSIEWQIMLLKLWV